MENQDLTKCLEFDVEFFKHKEQEMIANNETEIGVKLARLQFNILENVRAQVLATIKGSI